MAHRGQAARRDSRVQIRGGSSSIRRRNGPAHPRRRAKRPNRQPAEPPARGRRHRASCYRARLAKIRGQHGCPRPHCAAPALRKPGGPQRRRCGAGRAQPGAQVVRGAWGGQEVLSARGCAQPSAPPLRRRGDVPLGRAGNACAAKEIVMKSFAGYIAVTFLALLLAAACGGEKELSPAEQAQLVTHLNTARAYFTAGMDNQALGEYEMALAIDPKSVDAIDGRGAVYLSLERFDEALVDFNKAIELDPEFDVAYLHRANLYIKQNRVEEGFADLTKAIELNPIDPFNHSYRGDYYLAARNYPAAVADYTKAIELAPESSQLYSVRATAYALMGQSAKSALDVTKAVSLGADRARLEASIDKIVQDFRQ
ncbi:MAG: tetratricopeptide repeat protein [SAR202 cluster bacterium]|nr:tetratricopeptide repeat protein [SAR202 cluster bacterium]